MEQHNQSVKCKQCLGYKSPGPEPICHYCLQKNQLEDLLTNPPVWHKVLFDKLLESYDEVKEMGVDPEALIRRWRNIRATKLEGAVKRI